MACMSSYASGRPVPESPEPYVSGGRAPHGFRPPPGRGLRVEAARTGATLRLAVAGNFDYDTKTAFLDAVDGHLNRAGIRTSELLTDLRMDFSGLTHCDSSALSALIGVHRRVTGAGVRLHLDNRPQFLEHMLTLTGLADHFAGRPGGTGVPSPVPGAGPAADGGAGGRGRWRTAREE
jgi:anti-anti-sigma factor